MDVLFLKLVISCHGNLPVVLYECLCEKTADMWSLINMDPIQLYTGTRKVANTCYMKAENEGWFPIFQQV